MPTLEDIKACLVQNLDSPSLGRMSQAELNNLSQKLFELVEEKRHVCA